jgi:hypothetical protein
MTKLTLSADEETIRIAKRMAAERNMSVSALFSRFVQAMAKREWVAGDVGPIAAQASGLVELPADRSDEDLLGEALADRHGGG